MWHGFGFILLILLLPPLAVVYAYYRHEDLAYHAIGNLIIWLLFWPVAIIHAFTVIFECGHIKTGLYFDHPTRERRRAERQEKKAAYKQRKYQREYGMAHQTVQSLQGQDVARNDPYVPPRVVQTAPRARLSVSRTDPYQVPRVSRAALKLRINIALEALEVLTSYGIGMSVYKLTMRKVAVGKPRAEPIHGKTEMLPWRRLSVNEMSEEHED
ncbi:hypothetical protein EJ05DRAFT_509638 [Pseudovirgaria hyperparasitica]|uniref:Uncharacterized protein n=1 Tax=Pseudovirgaria hyperparasitica TaxID=470096 RepID=A0A6A6WCQ9_9PEZI|nr:uncharacterized protein EJ05DRAFT_509638 [Pseudovirgaria hyperparasitica]KAF2759969.1 hypothetical protein EJ05DRAFT_509638 [Pseudovirgaria hyperparasitica]